MINGTDLLHAVKNGDIEKVYPALGESPATEEIYSALYWAARLGYQDIVKLLIHHGADLNYQDYNGFTPLIWAAIYSPIISVLEVLIQLGADVHHMSFKRRQTALHASVIRGRTDFAALLLDNSAQPDCYDYLNKTPLLHATSKGHSECVRVLLQYNCKVDVSGVINGESMTPLLCALLNNNFNIVHMLMIAGAHFVKSAIYQTFTLDQFYETIELKLNLNVRPLYLQQQCRIRLREVLRPDFVKKLQGLSGILPQPMQSYLSLSELDRVTSICQS